MQMTCAVQIFNFHSWDRDESPDRLTVVRGESGYQLLLEKEYGGSVMLTMSQLEAADLGADIDRLYVGSSLVDYDQHKHCKTHRVEDAAGLEITVNITNRGEPYEEGVLIEIRSTDHQDSGAFSIELDSRVAQALSKALAPIVKGS